MRMCPSHSVTEQGREKISARCRPLSELKMIDKRACESMNIKHLGECRTSGLHSFNKKTIPPHSTPSITSQLLIRTPDKQHRHSDYDRYKQVE